MLQAVEKFEQRMGSVEVVDTSKHIFRIYFVNPTLTRLSIKAHAHVTATCTMH